MSNYSDEEVPSGIVKDNSYVIDEPAGVSEKQGTGPGGPVGSGVNPVIPDDAPVEDPIDPTKANSDEQLEKDEREAIDPSNIIEGRTRYGGRKPGVSYREPGDEEDMPPPDEGSSFVRTGKMEVVE